MLSKWISASVRLEDVAGRLLDELATHRRCLGWFVLRRRLCLCFELWGRWTSPIEMGSETITDWAFTRCFVVQNVFQLSHGRLLVDVQGDDAVLVGHLDLHQLDAAVGDQRYRS